MGFKFPKQAGIQTRYSGIRTTVAAFGVPIPIIFGKQRVAGKLIWYGDFQANKANQGKKGGGGGSGFGKEQTGYVYSAAVLVALAQGNCPNMLSVWDGNDKFQAQSISESFTIPSGGGSYQVANNVSFAADEGVGNPSGFSVAANDFGSPGPTTITGTQTVPFTRVVGSPGVGQYSVDASTGTYTFSAGDAGKQVVINYVFYRFVLTESELSTIPASPPYQVAVTHQPYYEADLGVQYYPSGIGLKYASGAPSQGTYDPNGGNYLFNALDKGQAVEINYRWKQVNTDANTPSKLNLTFVSGAIGQAPWSYLTSKHPGQDLGYSELCYIASSGLYLGFSPALPNYNYEVLGLHPFGGGISDANPADCIEDLLTDPSFGIGFGAQYIDASLQGLARAYWSANSFFISAVLETHETVASVIGKWLEASQVGAFWSEGLLKFIPYGDTTAVGNGATYVPPTQPVLALDDGDFLLPSGEEDPLQSGRTPYQDAWNQVGVRWTVRENNYNQDVVYAEDSAAIDTFGIRREAPVDYPFICTLAAAQLAANLRVQRYNALRNQPYRFKLKSNYAYLEPMDIITVPGASPGLPIRPIRIISIEDDPKEGLSVTAEDFPWSISSAVLYPKQGILTSPARDIGEQPGDTALLVVEMPGAAALQQGNILYIFATGTRSEWGGCDLYYSFDNSTYNFLTRISGVGRIGTLLNTLPATPDPDTVDTLIVGMTSPDAQLLSVPKSSADSLVTLSALVDQNSNLELIAYQNASLSGPAQYSLTYLRRGQYGTTVRSFTVNTSLFARIDEAGYKYQYAQIYVGKTVYLKALSFNVFGLQEQSLANVTALAVPLTGTAGAYDLGTGALTSLTAPGPVTNLAVTQVVVKDSSGKLSTQLAVSFTPPNDRFYYETQVWVAGYHGSSTPLQVAAGTLSPIVFPLDMTGETVTLYAVTMSTSGASSGLITSGNNASPSVLETLLNHPSVPPPPEIEEQLKGIEGGFEFGFFQEGQILANTIDSYRVYNNGSADFGSAILRQVIKHSPTDSGSVTVQDFPGHNITMSYWVTAVDVTGQESSPTFAGTASNALNPSNVIGPAVSQAPVLIDGHWQSGLAFSWTNPTDGAYDGVEIYVAGYQGVASPVKFWTKPDTVQSFSDWLLKTGEFVTFYFVSFDIYGFENAVAGSPSVSLTLNASDTAPNAPTGLTATAGFRQIALTWNQNAETDMQSYQVWRDSALLTTLKAIQGGGSAGQTQTYVDGGLGDNETHSYYVKAVDSHGNVSSPSSAVSSTTFYNIAPADNLIPNGNFLNWQPGSPQLADNWAKGSYNTGTYSQNASPFPPIGKYAQRISCTAGQGATLLSRQVPVKPSKFYYVQAAITFNVPTGASALQHYRVNLYNSSGTLMAYGELAGQIENPITNSFEDNSLWVIIPASGASTMMTAEGLITLSATLSSDPSFSATEVGMSSVTGGTVTWDLFEVFFALAKDNATNTPLNSVATNNLVFTPTNNSVSWSAGTITTAGNVGGGTQTIAVAAGSVSGLSDATVYIAYYDTLSQSVQVVTSILTIVTSENLPLGSFITKCNTPSSPSLSSTAFSGAPAVTYYVQTQYVRYVSGQIDVAGNLSAEASLAVTSGNTVQVASPATSGNATHYNVWLATSTGAEVLANSGPVPIGTNYVWFPVGSGSPPSGGGSPTPPSGGSGGGGTGGGGGCFTGDVRVKVPGGYKSFDEMGDVVEIESSTGERFLADHVIHEGNNEPMRRLPGMAGAVTEGHLFLRHCRPPFVLAMMMDGAPWIPAREKFTEKVELPERTVHNLHVRCSHERDQCFVLENGEIAHNLKFR